MANTATLALKCDCGESTATKDYIDIPEKCDKCGKQIQVALSFKGDKPWEKKAEEKPAKKSKKAEADK